MIRLLVLLALGCALTGCGRDDAAPREINLLAWSEYIPQSVIDGFQAETGIKVHYETFASNEEMLAKLLSGARRYDLVQPSEYATEALIRMERLRPIDRSAVPNFANLAPEFLDLPFDPGNRFTVPYMAGTVGIVVNTARVTTPVRGFADAFTPEHAGRIVVVNDNREILAWALAVEGLDLNDISPASMERVRARLAEWLPRIKVFDSDSPKTALLNGDVDIGVVWSGEAARLHEADPRFAFVMPVEGTHMFVDSLAVPTDAPDADAAHRFIDYLLRPEVGQAISAEFPYANPNARARERLTDAQRANPASYPPGGLPRVTFRDLGAAASDVDRFMTDLRGGM